MKIMSNNVTVRHMKTLMNRGVTSNARFRIVPLTSRSRRRKRGR